MTNNFPNGAGYHDYEDVDVTEEPEQTPRKRLLNDYKKEITSTKVNWTYIALIALFVAALLFAGMADQYALNAGVIH